MSPNVTSSPETTRTIADRGSTATSVRQPTHVLMVDDDRELCRVLQAALRLEGFELTVAYTIAHGLRAAVEEPFAVILLDIQLPDGDGRVVLPELRVVSGTPIIMMTGTGDEATRDACLQAGASGYLSKPFEFPELVAMIRRFARGTSA
jgi:two-component system, OmpR family, response regulator